MKNDPNRERLSGPELVSKIYLDLWKQSKGNFRKGQMNIFNIQFDVPKILPGNQKNIFVN
tara:strand:+ start:299 stop:478 length:180 start_codon:yes stop_codon:yes gene_type:complete